MHVKRLDSLMDSENLYYPVCGLINEFRDMDKKMTGKKCITGKQIQDWLINHFKKESGQYGLLAIDNKKSDYHLFIKIF